MYKYLQRRNDLIINGFKAARIAETVEKTDEVFHRIENPFLVYRSEQDKLPGRCLIWTIRYIKKISPLG